MRLVNNTILSRPVFQLPLGSGQITAFDKEFLSLMHSFSVTSANILQSFMLKLASLDYIFRRRQCGLFQTNFTYLAQSCQIR